MNIEALIAKFVKSLRYESYKTIGKDILIGGKRYSLNSQPGYEESEYLHENIRESVRGYSNSKDSAVEMYKGFVNFLQKNGVDVCVKFPPVSVSSSLDRQLYIAKYLQSPDAKVSDLEAILWVSPRTIESDLKSLRGEENPICVGGKKFYIPNMERDRGSVRFASTAHPLFLTENLTQVIIMLKGLKTMSEIPIYTGYAVETAADIWSQLSDYAKDRIHFVLSSIMAEDVAWYEALPSIKTESFRTEEACSRVKNAGSNVVLNCLKNGKQFCMEYNEGDSVKIYTECKYIKSGFGSGFIEVECMDGLKTFELDRIIRSAYTAEELLAD